MSTTLSHSPCIVRGISFVRLAEEWLEKASTVVTLNMSHLQILSEDAEFRESYKDATIITLDSNCLNRFFLKRAMTVATGSDFVRHLLGSGRLVDRSVLIIGNVSAAEASSLLPWSRTHVLTPSWGFIRDPAAVSSLVADALQLDPDIVFVAVGAPQSEKLVRRLRAGGLGRCSILCCGASFEFELGRQQRSPGLVSALGIEWIWRLAKEPRRLARRYGSAAGFLVARFSQFRNLARTRRLDVGGLVLEFREDQEVRTVPLRVTRPIWLQRSRSASSSP